jgi:hypothetical protein
MLNSAAQAATARALAQIGEPCTFKRISGTAPRVDVISVTVNAIVRNYQPDSGNPSRQGFGSGQVGSITEGDREVIVMTQDLVNARFPLPLMKHDKIFVASSGETLDVTQVDANKRSIAGAIELRAVGVA